jgi:hypothetical protein
VAPNDQRTNQKPMSKKSEPIHVNDWAVNELTNLG